MGMKFHADVAGTIDALRFWWPSEDTFGGTYTGHLWTSGGTELASVAFDAPSVAGWQQKSLSSPVSINANTTYVVSVNIGTASTAFPFTASGLASAITNGHLSSEADGSNGVFNSTAGSFPNTAFNNGNYFRDVVFTASGGGSPVTIYSGNLISVLQIETIPSGVTVTVQVRVHEAAAWKTLQTYNNASGLVELDFPVRYNFVRVQQTGTGTVTVFSRGN
jgi:hypothetical protein